MAIWFGSFLLSSVTFKPHLPRPGFPTTAGKEWFQAKTFRNPPGPPQWVTVGALSCGLAFVFTCMTKAVSTAGAALPQACRI